MRTYLATYFQKVPEALRGDKGDARTVSLYQGIRGDRCPVIEARNLSGLDTEFSAKRLEASDDCLGWMFRRRRRFEVEAFRRVLVEGTEVGECASHVDADDPSHGTPLLYI